MQLLPLVDILFMTAFLENPSPWHLLKFFISHPPHLITWVHLQQDSVKLFQPESPYFWCLLLVSFHPLILRFAPWLEIPTCSCCVWSWVSSLCISVAVVLLHCSSTEQSLSCCFSKCQNSHSFNRGESFMWGPTTQKCVSGAPIQVLWQPGQGLCPVRPAAPGRTPSPKAACAYWTLDLRFGVICLNKRFPTPEV